MSLKSLCSGDVGGGGWRKLLSLCQIRMQLELGRTSKGLLTSCWLPVPNCCKTLPGLSHLLALPVAIIQKEQLGSAVGEYTPASGRK